MWKEFMDYPTFHDGKSVIETTLNQKVTAFSAVANTGTMKNWCGYVMAQANWYAFGRLAWNPNLSAREIAKEWVMQTITKDEQTVNTICDIMMQSREAVTNYMTPIGLHHLMGWSDHWGPEPWTSIPGAREDWLPRYYHKAAADGIGFNRSSKNDGSNAVEQYQEPRRSMYDDPQLCPRELVLWFHHLPWNYYFNDGKTVWETLLDRYNGGVQQMRLNGGATVVCNTSKRSPICRSTSRRNTRWSNVRQNSAQRNTFRDRKINRRYLTPN